MREVVLMWRDSRMIILTLVVTAVYTAVLIPFKGFVLIPGVTEVRLANVFPVVFSLLFGPAAAWGAAFGNLVGDVFGGTLSPGSAFGFVGNFFYGFAGYKLWGNLGRLSSGRAPAMDGPGQVVEFVAIALVSAAGTGAVIAWGLDLLGLVPFSTIGAIIAVNDFLVTAVLGPPVLRVLYPWAERDGLLYPDLMPERALPSVPPARQGRAAAAIAVVSVGWLVAGVVLSLGPAAILDGLVMTPAHVPVPPGGTAQLTLGAVAIVALFLASLRSGERLSGLLERSS